MNLVTLNEESFQQGGFYVPQYEVKVGGENLPSGVVRDIVSLTYKDNIKEIDSFEVTVNNWDTFTQDFKYVGAETAASLESSANHSLFDPCGKDVEVWMGYLNELRLMVKGTFTTLEPNFLSGGGPTLTVRGLNALHKLRTKQYTNTWGDIRDSDVVKNKIGTLLDAQTHRKRFPMPIEIAPGWEDREPLLPYLAQNNQYDIDYLLSRARERGYVVFIAEADAATHKPQRLYFGPSTANVAGLRDVTFVLKWGTSLIDFKPTLTTANQIKSVTVNGWDRRTRQPIHETVTIDDSKLNINADLRKTLGKCDPREERVVDEPVHTKQQARDRAFAILSDRHKDLVKASGSTVGLADLRAGQRVKIEGLGVRFSGLYFVTATTHTINDSGYITRFEARREDQ